MVRRKLWVLVLSVVLVFAVAGVAMAAEGSKQVKINYENIKIFVDGKQVFSAQEPFILNGTTYVPLRMVGEALNSVVNWQGQTKTISITSTPPVELTTLRMQLAAKDTEIQNLKNQIASLQDQLAQRDEDEDEDDIDDIISDLEDELNDDYDEFVDGIEVDDISLDGDEDDVDVEIYLDIDLEDEDDQADWDDLDVSDIEDWIEDLVDDIQNELDDDTEVNGEIFDSNDDEIGYFSKDGDDDLEVDVD